MVYCLEPSTDKMGFEVSNAGPVLKPRVLCPLAPIANSYKRILSYGISVTIMINSELAFLTSA